MTTELLSTAAGDHERHPPVRVRLLAEWSVIGGDGLPVRLSIDRRAVLAALAVAERPMTRVALASAAGVSRSTLNSLLTRLAAALRAPAPIHTSAGRNGPVELNRSLVWTDIAELRAILSRPGLGRADGERLLSLGVHRQPTSPVGLVTSDQTGAELAALLEDLKAEALRRLAWFDLGPEGRVAPLTDGMAIPPGAPAELRWAELDRVARAQGRSTAADQLAVSEQEGPHHRTGHRDDGAVARVIIETARRSSALHTTLSDEPPGADPVRATLDHHLSRSPVRVMAVELRNATRADIERTLQALARHRPGSLVAWADRAESPVAVVAKLIEPVLHDRVRTRDAGVPMRFLHSYLAIRSDESLEPFSNIRWFCQQVAELYETWHPGGDRLIILGRLGGAAVDLDRILADLLRLDPHLRLAIVHGQATTERTELDEFSSAVEVVPLTGRAASTEGGKGTADSVDDDLVADPGGRYLPWEPKEALDGWVAGILSVAADDEGLLLANLAEHLLRSTGAALSYDDAIAALPSTVDPVAGRLRAPVASLSDGLSRSERSWLGCQAATWLLQDRVPTGLELAVLARAVRLIDTGSALTSVIEAARAAATVAASHGDHHRAIALLTAVARSDLVPNQLAAVLTQRAVSQREVGQWMAALDDHRQAVKVIQDDAGSVGQLAEIVLSMARLTWDPAVGEEVDHLLWQVLGQLPSDEEILRARVRLCLAGGSFQDGASGLGRVKPEAISHSLSRLNGAVQPAARAWGLVHGRKALLDVVTVAESISLSEQIVRHSGVDVSLLAHGNQALFVDRLRQGRLDEAATALAAVRHLALTPVSAEQRFSAEVASTCWAMARGDHDAAAAGLTAELAFQPLLGGLTFDQVTLAHAAWLARRGENPTAVDELATAAAGLASSAGGAIWSAGAALLTLDAGRPAEAGRILSRFAEGIGGLQQLARGPHRLPVLAIGAWVAAAGRAEGGPSPLADDDLNAIVVGLDDTDTALILLGWPTVVLGPVDRFRALIQAARGDSTSARIALDRATILDDQLPDLDPDHRAARTLLDRLC